MTCNCSFVCFFKSGWFEKYRFCKYFCLNYLKSGNKTFYLPQVSQKSSEGWGTARSHKSEQTKPLMRGNRESTPCSSYFAGWTSGRPPLPVLKKPVNEAAETGDWDWAGQVTWRLVSFLWKNLSKPQNRERSPTRGRTQRVATVGVLLSRPKGKGFYTKRRGCFLNQNRKLRQLQYGDSHSPAGGKGAPPHTCDLQILKSQAQWGHPWTAALSCGWIRWKTLYASNLSNSFCLSLNRGAKPQLYAPRVA